MNDNADRAERGKLASARGYASESRLLAALLERGHNASRVELPHSTYDIVVEESPHNIIRVQVKTVSPSKSVSFQGGVRGGVEMQTVSDEKQYTQDTKTSDIVVGVESSANNGDSETDFYFIPTLLIEILGQKSLSANLIRDEKNDWDILFRCKEEDFVKEKFAELIAKKRPDLADKQILLELN